MIKDIPPNPALAPDLLIRRLQSRLLSLSEDEDTVSAAEIERTAKAITQLITSIERAESFLQSRTETTRAGFRLEGEARQRFLRRVRCFVERGGLDELNDEGDVEADDHD